MANVIGLFAIKINGIYRIDAKSTGWKVTRVINQIVTQGGVRKSKGVALCQGTLEEVVPKSAIFDWTAVDDFTLHLYDKETRSILYAGFEDVSWESIDGKSDLGSAMTTKSIAWKGTQITKT